MLVCITRPYKPMVATLHTLRSGNSLGCDAWENHLTSYGPSLFLLNCWS